jgi:hypothetical protein
LDLIADCVPAVKISAVATTLINIKEKMAMIKAAPLSETGRRFIFLMMTSQLSDQRPSCSD